MTVAVPRQYHQQMIHYLRKDFTYADTGKNLLMGAIPAGSLIIKPISGINVHTAFNGSGTDLVDIGTLADPDLYATDLAAGSVGFAALDEAVSMYVAVDTDLYVTFTDTNGDATAGVAQAIIAFIPSSNG
jgi:hypothetical protein